MIGARLPESAVSLHPVVADKGVHDGILEGVAHMQAASDIWRGNHDAEGVALARGLEMARFFPGFVPALLDGLRIIGFFPSYKDSVLRSRPILCRPLT